MSVARTILEQLGSNRFAAMTGAKNFVAMSGAFEGVEGLQFAIGRNEKRINRVTITLNSLDLYDVTFWKIRGTRCETVAEFQNVYCDQLRYVFETATGLRTSL